MNTEKRGDMSPHANKKRTLPIRRHRFNLICCKCRLSFFRRIRRKEKSNLPSKWCFHQTGWCWFQSSAVKLNFTQRMKRSSWIDISAATLSLISESNGLEMAYMWMTVSVETNFPLTTWCSFILPTSKSPFVCRHHKWFPNASHKEAQHARIYHFAEDAHTGKKDMLH